MRVERRTVVVAGVGLALVGGATCSNREFKGDRGLVGFRSSLGAADSVFRAPWTPEDAVLPGTRAEFCVANDLAYDGGFSFEGPWSSDVDGGCVAVTVGESGDGVVHWAGSGTRTLDDGGTETRALDDGFMVRSGAAAGVLASDPLVGPAFVRQWPAEAEQELALPSKVKLVAGAPVVLLLHPLDSGGRPLGHARSMVSATTESADVTLEVRSGFVVLSAPVASVGRSARIDLRVNGEALRAIDVDIVASAEIASLEVWKFTGTLLFLAIARDPAGLRVLGPAVHWSDPESPLVRSAIDWCGLSFGAGERPEACAVDGGFSRADVVAFGIPDGGVVAPGRTFVASGGLGELQASVEFVAVEPTDVPPGGCGGCAGAGEASVLAAWLAWAVRRRKTGKIG